jgi:transposase
MRRRLQKVLEGANIKLSDVASNVLGASGRAMLEALVKGESDPTTLAQLAKAGLKKKTTQLEQALRGMIGLHQRLMLRQLLNHVDFLARQIGLLDREMVKRMRQFEAVIEMLDAIYRIGGRTDEDILAEIGVDMSRWPSDRHIASWPRSAPATTRVPASATRAGRARAIAGSVASWRPGRRWSDRPPEG